jgi:hypothetical protein
MIPTAFERFIIACEGIIVGVCVVFIYEWAKKEIRKITHKNTI